MEWVWMMSSTDSTVEPNLQSHALGSSNAYFHDSVQLLRSFKLLPSRYVRSEFYSREIPQKVIQVDSILLFRNRNGLVEESDGFLALRMSPSLRSLSKPLPEALFNPSHLRLKELLFWCKPTADLRMDRPKKIHFNSQSSCAAHLEKTRSNSVK